MPPPPDRERVKTLVAEALELPAYPMPAMSGQPHASDGLPGPLIRPRRE